MNEVTEPFWDPDEPGIFDDPAVVAAADARAIADIEAGRVISNEAVMRWLQSIVDGKRIPPPQVGD
ncbi:CopG family transcriptional regulator [Sphingomonas sp. S1-29]|uniref:CopG family transcriptional regulator n=1 Tax=Sphingomonas sp. S1-29 TaxID=2991074 RepID=UPI002240A44C|nr:CopG family transcriptional regulator [Sphingomonas sp. S1-29]UZK69371.1 CopG family transcriptional regulator [Sphingomonas sp. S1-29]